MAKKIIWSKEAIEDVDFIAEFIKMDSQYYASVFTNEIIEKAETLTAFSKRGRIVPEMLDENIREIFIGDYRLLYRIEKDQISIIAVIHGSRDLKKVLLKKKR